MSERQRSKQRATEDHIQPERALGRRSFNARKRKISDQNAATTEKKLKRGDSGSDGVSQSVDSGGDINMEKPDPVDNEFVAAALPSRAPAALPPQNSPGVSQQQTQQAEDSGDELYCKGDGTPYVHKREGSADGGH